MPNTRDALGARQDEKALGTLQAALGYEFKDKGLLMEALTHKSYYYEHRSKCKSYNERLEFLGDSVLSLMVAERLYGVTPPMDEARMSKIKSYVVKASILTEAATRLSIGEILLIGRGEEETGGRTKSSLLANAMEAIIGAIFLDAGYSASRSIVMSLIGVRLDEALKSGELHDYKTDLQEVCQDEYSVLPEYKVISESGEEHSKVFTVQVLVKGRSLGQGSGRSKKEAQQNAAREALKTLRKSV